NGKGSVCAFVSSILAEAGYGVGLYTSPHLARVNERIKLNGRDISDEGFARVFKDVTERCKLKIGSVSFFSLLTAMAFEYFAQMGADFAVVEAGIGGRLDSTNAVRSAAVSAIVSIGLDHTELLGETIEKIAYEKAGIIKKNVPVAVGRGVNCPAVARRAAALGSPVLEAGKNLKITGAVYDKSGTRFSVENDFFSYADLYIKLLGAHQVENAALALTVINSLASSCFKISEGAVRDGLSKTKWRGRFEVYCKEPEIVLDGAHNEDGAESFNKSLEMYYGGKNIVLLAGTLMSKDGETIINKLIGDKKMEVVCTRPPHAKALPPETLASHIKNKDVGIHIIDDCYEAFRFAKKLAGRRGVVAAAGSLYLIGGLYDRLQG
ncbi:MAG: bifunctional folylpolyglutamate synthase/dihydrofolate synthase, partial [Defluviitaleaceae bacterium]|nr:bifunctional folylpolyglutamate synthase/dihydrofolate synthase [Defluviitaleaceae bacterium]